MSTKAGWPATAHKNTCSDEGLVANNPTQHLWHTWQSLCVKTALDFFYVRTSRHTELSDAAEYRAIFMVGN